MPYHDYPDIKRVEMYFGGLSPQIQGLVMANNPSTIQQAVRLAHKLTDAAVTHGTLPKRGASSSTSDNKRKWEDNKTTSSN